MSIAAGTRLGPYEIVARIGAGGMGEVWKARDTRLGRIVAVKVSSEQFSDRMAREARTIAALNHPHICQVYDVGPNYIVMEYIDGQTLAGPLPLDRALQYAVQICDALGAAHRAGVVHRDLKPANILVTSAGIKLLDFGLAKMTRALAPTVETQTLELTQDKSILGTLPFMSPEQLEGKEADARSDIFSFGSVLYEMLTGKPAFTGASQAGLIAAIMDRDPPPVSSLEPTVPRSLDRVVSKCLAKSPERRWQSADDLRDELQWIAESLNLAAAAVGRSRGIWRERAGWILGAALLGGLLFWAGIRQRAPAPVEQVRFTLYPPEDAVFSGPGTVPTPQFALASDGRAIVYAAAAGAARPSLWLRLMNEESARPLPGTEDAQYPFWSPDNRSVAFFAEGRLRKVPIAGGSAQTVVSEGLLDPRGGAWGADGTIVFSTGNGGLLRVSADGGASRPVMLLGAGAAQGAQRWPRFLPDGRHLLFTVLLPQRTGIYAGSLDQKTSKFLVRFNSNSFYVDPGYLLYMDGETLLGQAFNAARQSLEGEPFTVAEPVGRSGFGNGAVSASRTGVLAYAAPTVRMGRLTWFDRDGKALDTVGPEGDYTDFRLSPDGKRLAATLVDPKTGAPEVWLTDLQRGSSSRFAFGPSLSASPIWSPDGGRLVFRRNPLGETEFFEKSAAGAGDEAVVLSGNAERAANIRSVTLIPTDWSPNGRNILFSVPAAGSGFELWLLPIAGDQKPVRYLQSTADAMHANFSPDGRLVAYSSNESGRFEVYVQTFPLSDRKWQVSTNGGYEPRWRADGREIYYLAEDRKLMASEVTGPSFSVPKPLFATHAPAGVNALRTNYAPANDGRRFLVNELTGEPPRPSLTVVLNWNAGR